MREPWLGASKSPGKVMLSFDIESVYHIEAVRGQKLSAALRAELCGRVARQVDWLRRVLDKHESRATFFWVGELAWRMPYLVRALQHDGHEIACHSWEHCGLWRQGADEFARDLEVNKRVLEDITGEPVMGFRAPTFSVMKKTSWAILVLRDLGFGYDSSIYPIIHDRYGVRGAPCSPFRVAYRDAELLELPPATWQIGPIRLPIGGGGYFRLWPLCLSDTGIRKLLRQTGYAMLYFHPWEFDAEQPRLPMGYVQGWRTYAGIRNMRYKLISLLSRYQFVLARQVAKELDARRSDLPLYQLD